MTRVRLNTIKWKVLLLTLKVKFEFFTLMLMAIATVLIKKLLESEEGKAYVTAHQYKRNQHKKIVYISK